VYHKQNIITENLRTIIQFYAADFRSTLPCFSRMKLALQFFYDDDDDDAANKNSRQVHVPVITKLKEVQWHNHCCCCCCCCYNTTNLHLLLLARLMGQYCFARWCLSSVVVCNAAGEWAGWPPGAWEVGRRARRRLGGRHCMAGQHGYVPLERQLV